MKHFYRCLILLLVVHNQVHAEWVPPWEITGRNVDSTLSQGTGMFAVKFIAPNGTMATGLINITLDHCNISQQADANGKVYFAASAGKHVIYFSTYYYEEIKTDTLVVADRERIEITVRFENDNEPRPMKKPVIYVYAQQKTPVHISLDLEYNLLFSYPTYGQGWEFTALPGGTLMVNEKAYNYLFWEGGDAAKAFELRKHNEGYMVKTDTLLHFLENSLTAMGFNSKEQQDFITYWYPQMKKYEVNYVHFVFNTTNRGFPPMKCTPAPQNLYRMSMLWLGTDTSFIVEETFGRESRQIELKPQVFPVIKREGLTIVEWGGAEMRTQTVYLKH